MLGALGRTVGLFLFGLIFVGVGLAVMWFMGAQTTLACARPGPRTGTCTLTQTNLFGRVNRAESLRLTEIERAEVQVSVDDDGSDTYRVVLRTERGTVPFTDYYSSGRTDKRETADRLNAFLEDDAARELEVSQDDRLFASIFGGVFSCAGGLVALAGLLSPLGALRRGRFGR